MKMDRAQEETLAEQEALLSECKLYKGEKEPETKNAPTENVEEEAVTGVPVGPGLETTVVGAQVPRSPWSTGLFQCFGTGDEHFSSDLEVCVLGTFAPCVLYGSNMERLYSGRRVFAGHCMRYGGLYFLGSVLFNANTLAPCFSVGSRIALRQKYNLKGYGEPVVGYCGASTDECRDGCDSFCDIVSHCVFHSCALCQEGRELRRRTLHPAYQPYLVMAAPVEQSMSA